AACDRAGREVKRLADRAIALVAREEAVEDLPAVLRERRQRLVDRERLVERVQRLIQRPFLDRLGRLLAPAGPQPVNAQPARQLREPGPECLVVTQLPKTLVHAGEALLEDVLRVRLPEPESPDRDGVDVSRVVLDQVA